MTPVRKRTRRVREREAAPTVVLLDANVIFDVLLLRAPWHLDAARLFEAIVTHNVSEFEGSPLPVLTPAHLVARLAL